MRRRSSVVIAMSLPVCVLVGLLLYRWIGGSNVAGNWLTTVMIIAGSLTTVASLMVYLQGGDSAFTRFDSPATAGLESRDELRRTRRELDRLRADVEGLRAHVSALITSQEALSAEQTAGLVRSVTQKIEAEASHDFVAKIRQEIEQQSKVSDALTYSRETADRLLREVSALSRRGNLNLSIGITITGIGLGLLGYVVFQALQVPKEPWALVSHYVPRLSLVLFIELFAYFFLRLYKASLTEIKYFQNELTNVEAKRLALIVALNQSAPEPVAKVVDELAKTERNFVLEKGQTTIELEAARLESESSATLLEKAAGILDKIGVRK
jgi:hypothetical protein